MRYNDELAIAYKRCKYDIYCRPQRAYCKMQYNPAYPTSYPYGYFQLWEFTPSSPLYIWGYMQNLPYTGKRRHGFSIHEKNWDGKDCCSAGKQLQHPNQTHKWPTHPIGHTGQLWPLWKWTTSYSWTWQSLPKPSFWGTYNINYKTMVVYEDGDDYGFGGTFHSKWYGSGGQRIACCTIRPYYIIWDTIEPEPVDDNKDLLEEPMCGDVRCLAGEVDADVDAFTPDQFRELFGYEPEMFAYEKEQLGQN